jgi:WD40 repeat protein
MAAQPKLRATREWQTAGVGRVAISPDGRTVAAAVTGNTIQLWDVASGKEQASLKTSYGAHSLAFSPDGENLASGMAYNNVKVWHVAKRESTTLLDNPKPKRQSILDFVSPMVVFSSDGKMLASGGKCIREIRLWNVTTGKQTAAFEGHDEFGVRALAFTPDGKTLASVGADGSFTLWEVATGKPTATRKIVDRTPAAALSPDAKTLATIYEVEATKGAEIVTEHSVKLWDVATRKELATLKIEWGGAMTFSPDGKTFALGRGDGTITLWDVSKGKELATFSGHTDLVGSLAFSANGALLASGSRDKTVKLWDVGKAK